MIINGYKLNYTEAELNTALGADTLAVRLAGKSLPSYQALSENEKQALGHLISAAEFINDVYLQQHHPLNLVMRRQLKLASKHSPYAAKTLALFNSMNGVCGRNAVDKEESQLFVGVGNLPATNCYPPDITTAEFHKIILSMLKQGKTQEVQAILSPRTVVRRQGFELAAIDYTEYFKKEFKAVAGELNKAAELLKDEPDDKQFRDFLLLQAKALLADNPYADADADKAWAKMQDTKFEFTISRENYDDMLTGTVLDNPEIKDYIDRNQIEVHAKDMLAARVGLINKEGTELILQFKKHLQQVADIMPYQDKYSQRNFSETDDNQTMVDVDLFAFTGDFAAPKGGLCYAQNLPNNDKLAIKQGGGHRNVYHRQVRQSTPVGRRVALEKLLSPEVAAFITERSDLLFSIGHENGHSLGPDAKYQDSMGTNRNTIEELKANTIAVVGMNEYFKAGIITKDDLQRVYTYALAEGFLNHQPNASENHRMADLLAYNYFKEKEVITFAPDNKVNFNFEKLPQVAAQLLTEVIGLQLSQDVKEGNRFIEKYSGWDERQQYAADVMIQAEVPRYRAILPQIKDKGRLNQTIRHFEKMSALSNKVYE